MNKKGFTLAEVLITLGLIGVVAALTLPALVTNTTSAQVGPKLAKAVSSFEQANESLLNANSVDTLSEGGFLTSAAVYGTALSNHLKITSNGTSYITKDGMSYTFAITNANPASGTPSHTQRIGDVTVDINGNTKPNVSGTDIFFFSWWNDGSLRPKGGTNWDAAATSVTGGDTHWSKKCPANAVPDDMSFCAGHVFENNLKVLYK